MSDNIILFKSMSLRRSWALGYILVVVTIVVIFLTGHALKVSPKYLCSYPQTWASLHPGQRSFLFLAVGCSNMGQGITCQVLKVTD